MSHGGSSGRIRDMAKQAMNTICLRYDRDAEAAARFSSHRGIILPERKGMC
jgi:hypothetical protein